MIVKEKNRESLIKDNLGLVHACANRFKGRGVEYDDLFQAGCLGLIKAADGFDADRGFSFSTYAVPVIMGEIKRIFRDGGTIKVGRAMKDKIRTATKIKEDYVLKCGTEPTVSVIAERMGIEPAEAAEILNASMPIISLTCDDDSDRKQLDIPTDSPDEEISDCLALEQTLEALSESDKRLIRLRYYDGLTQSKTAQIMGISQVQVSRKEKKILLEMRRKLV